MQSKSGFPFGCAGAILLALAVQLTHANEVVVRNDSFDPPGQVNVQAGFVANERAAAWLTSPCGGNIVAVQILWRSVSGTTGQSLEDSITIHANGTFPTPGPVLLTLEGPVMTDNAINEFRYIDEQQTIPISIPVTNGQRFIVSFQFANTPSPTNGPSVCTDVGSGCQPQKNGIFAIPPSAWFNSCLLGVSGDFVIRAVVDCTDTPGACCVPNGSCVPNLTLSQCQQQGGLWKGPNSTCTSSTCNQACCFQPSGCVDLSLANCNGAGGFPQGLGTTCATTICFPNGACCRPDGTCVNGTSPSECENMGGVWQGNNSLCQNVSCPQPSAACCLSNNFCLLLTAADCAQIPNSSWKGYPTDCSDGNGDSIADACQNLCGGILKGDMNFDTVRNGGDVSGYVEEWLEPSAPGSPSACAADFDGNNTLSSGDLTAFVNCLLTGSCVN